MERRPFVGFMRELARKDKEDFVCNGECGSRQREVGESRRIEGRGKNAEGLRAALRAAEELKTHFTVVLH